MQEMVKTKLQKIADMNNFIVTNCISSGIADLIMESGILFK